MELCESGSPRALLPQTPSADARSWILMADESGPLAWFGVDDPLRPSASEAIDGLAKLDLSLEMLSGDPSPDSALFAERLGLLVASRNAGPAMKVERIRELHGEKEIVVAVGDGVNDGPFMRVADVSIAMGSGSDLTRTSADAVLINDNLVRIPLAIEWARKTRRVIGQNFGWAIAYNVCVLPLAMSGRLVPWVAALGMSLSSLVVVLNATRLARIPSRS